MPAASVTASVAIGNSSAPASTLETGTITPTGSNKGILVEVGSGATSPSNITAVKYASAAGVGGELMTQVDSTRTISTNMKMSCFKLANPIASSGTIWVQYAGTDDERWIEAVAVQDWDGSLGSVTYTTATTSSAITGNAVTTAGNLALSFCSVLDTSGSSPTLTAGQTLISKLDGGTPAGGSATNIGVNEAAGASRQTAAGTSTTMSWTISATRDWGQFAFQVNGVTAAPGGTAIALDCGGWSAGRIDLGKVEVM